MVERARKSLRTTSLLRVLRAFLRAVNNPSVSTVVNACEAASFDMIIDRERDEEVVVDDEEEEEEEEGEGSVEDNRSTLCIDIVEEIDVAIVDDILAETPLNFRDSLFPIKFPTAFLAARFAFPTETSFAMVDLSFCSSLASCDCTISARLRSSKRRNTSLWADKMCLKGVIRSALNEAITVGRRDSETPVVALSSSHDSACNEP
jgi:hypothetical protein